MLKSPKETLSTVSYGGKELTNISKKLSHTNFSYFKTKSTSWLAPKIVSLRPPVTFSFTGKNPMPLSTIMITFMLTWTLTLLALNLSSRPSTKMILTAKGRLPLIKANSKCKIQLLSFLIIFIKDPPFIQVSRSQAHQKIWKLWMKRKCFSFHSRPISLVLLANDKWACSRRKTKKSKTRVTFRT